MKRRTRVLAFGMAAALALTACGGGGTSDNNSAGGNEGGDSSEGGSSASAEEIRISTHLKPVTVRWRMSSFSTLRCQPI